ncbi:MAG: hypothetical protein LIO71_01310 [Ruminococcus sp.]|nr:hypothetical protein [Ruminococcus sp.]MCC8119265.1 hypothetical protein [Bacteroidales bacterium]
MALIIHTNQFLSLQSKLNLAIQLGVINTWIVDDEGDYTIAKERWRMKAWFRLRQVSEHEAIFGIVSSKKYPLTKEIYGVYHGRLAATLLSHFDNLIDSIEIPALLDSKWDIYS